MSGRGFTGLGFFSLGLFSARRAKILTAETGEGRGGCGKLCCRRSCPSQHSSFLFGRLLMVTTVALRPDPVNACLCSSKSPSGAPAQARHYTHEGRRETSGTGGSKELSSVKRAWAAGPGMMNTELCICWLALLPVGSTQPSLAALKNVVENALDRSCSRINADFCKIVLLHANRARKRLQYLPKEEVVCTFSPNF